MAKIKDQQHQTSGEDVEQMEVLQTVDEVNHVKKQFGNFLKSEMYTYHVTQHFQS